MENWYQLNVDETLGKLKSETSGLSADEAKERLLRFGPNELKARKKTPAILVLGRQFLSPLIYVLLVAADYIPGCTALYRCHSDIRSPSG